jgi:hypothetical protein
MRSRAPIDDDHLVHLSVIAAADREKFYLTRPEYRDRHLATVLAQGAALHFLDGKNGVKDLDVWSFFALPRGVTRFPADRRNVHVDFGPSTLGRQPYDLDAAPNAIVRAQWARWSTFEGRRVDLLMRGLQCSRRSDPVDVIRGWLITGQAKPDSSPDRLARKAVIMIDPPDRRGEIVWPPDYPWPASRVRAEVSEQALGSSSSSDA